MANATFKTLSGDGLEFMAWVSSNTGTGTQDAVLTIERGSLPVNQSFADAAAVRTLTLSRMGSFFPTALGSSTAGANAVPGAQRYRVRIEPL